MRKLKLQNLIQFYIFIMILVMILATDNKMMFIFYCQYLGYGPFTLLSKKFKLLQALMNIHPINRRDKSKYKLRNHHCWDPFGVRVLFRAGSQCLFFHRLWCACILVQANSPFEYILETEGSGSGWAARLWICIGGDVHELFN